MKRRLLALLAALVLLGVLPVTAFAHDVPDLSRKGSVTISMTYDGQRIPGGSLTLYRVGSITEDDGNYSFEPTGVFADSGASFADLQSATLAEDLAEFAASKKAVGITKTVDKEGVASFTELELGLYLVVQKKAAEGYNAVKPFLVSLPKMTDGVYVYEVDATPKMGEITVAPTEKPTTPSKPSGGKLPQTGQLNWPVPMLAVVGMLLFTAGWLLRFGKRQEFETE